MFSKKFLGGFIGTIIGFLLGASIPSQIGTNMSFLQRMTGSVILQDPSGLVISLSYALMGGAILGFAGAMIGARYDSDSLMKIRTSF